MEVRRMAGRMQWRTCLVCVLLSFAVLCGAQQSQNFQLPDMDPPSDLRVDSSGTVFVAAGNELFRLDSNFDQQERMELAMSPVTIQRIALSQDESRVVVCLDDESCVLYNASNFVAEALLTRGVATAGVEEVTVFTSPSDSFYAGSYGTVLVPTNAIYLTQYGFGGSEFIRKIGTGYNGNSGSLVRTFYGGFVAGTNAYYIVYDSNPSGVRGIKVLRICDLQQCPRGAGSCEIDALYEAQLSCGAVGASTAICGVTLLSTFDGISQNRLVVSLCEIGRNRIYSYSFTEIDTAMDTLYSICSAGTGTVPQPVWIGTGTLPCAGFMSENECSGFSGPAALTTSPISGTVHVDLGFSVESLSSTLALTVDGSTLLYVGYTVGGQHFVGRYHIRSDSMNIPFSDVTVVAQPTSPVRHLQWVEEMEYIYAATEGDSSDEIAPVVFRIPVEQCSTFTDCQSCTADTNPLCGWCTVEDKCSRRSECRNSSEPMRWVQETDQCISSVADPMTFVLDNPQNITVTVTPGLPPPLDGESYECYFTAADGTSFSTDAVEVMTNTQYMCNLTEVVPDFQGASLVTDFSFRSTAVGIPFATEEGGVTVYDCPEPSSCSECLQTQNACGWCIYNKRCRGTPEPCLNSNEMFFLSPGVGQSFEDICPLLEPGLFSGEYVQPVTIERNITLITSNLPEPITGFSYGCMIGDVALSVEYVDETSFTCIVEGNQLSLLSGDNDGRDSVPVRIVWRSDDGMVVHNIDTRDGAAINTLLYDCNEVASTCSACLVSSIGTGLECAWLDSGSCVLNTTAGTTADPLQCPDPVITGISPTMGPLEGGTTITITGTDLGTMFSDVDGNVTISGQLCDTTGQESGYVPGLVIVCETPNLGDTNDFTIMVTLLRASGLINAPSPVPFTAITPNVTGVEPDLGPVTGGTILTVMGTNLGIGNVEDTMVTVGGENCAVQNHSSDISETEISCTTAAFTGDSSQCSVDPQSNGTCPSFSSSVVVVVSVDAFTSHPGSTSFDYRCEPTFSSVSPTDTIPAGGIRLTFSGCNLNVLQQPSLVLTGSRRRQTGLGSCSVTNATSMLCIAPMSSASATAPGIIVMNAAGPNIPIEDLQLTVVANPVFPTGFNQEYTEESGSSIQIEGTDLTNVETSEYRVTVGGQPCAIIARTQELLCTPPQLAPGGQNEAPVMVFVGQNLNFSVGTLTYVTGDSGVSVSTIAIAVGVSGGSILTIIVILVIFYRYSSNSRKKVFFSQSVPTSLFMDKDLGELQLQPTVIQNQPLDINEFMKQLPQKLIVASDQLQLLESIGQGEFGTVYKAHLIHWHGHEEPQLVAAKTLKGLFSPNDVQSMMDEILKMQDFDHPHVMSLLGVCLDARLRLSTIMPYMANGSLLDYLKKDRMHLVISESETPDMICSVQKLLLRMCYQIAQGMEYLAEQKFVHRDLAARNCMLNHRGDIKVADFGLGEDMYATGYFRQTNVDASVKLPYKWMPPESLEDGLFSEKSDVWAFGVTCWEVFTGGKIPYPAMDPMSLMKLLENGQRLEKPSNSASSRKIYSALMQRCWLDEPSIRPAFSELVLSLSQMLESVAGYKELSMTLVQPAAAEIPVEKNPVYGIVDGIPVEANPVYGMLH